MSETPPPVGKETAIVPYLMVRDPDVLCDFYQRAFGFEIAERIPDEAGKPVHIGMLFQGWRIIMFAPEGSNPDDPKMVSPMTSGEPGSASFHVQHPDVDALAKRAEAAGAKIIRPPVDEFYGERTVVLEDIEGFKWSFGMPVK